MLAPQRFGVGGDQQVVAAGGLQCAAGLASVFGCLIGEFEDHDAASIARDSRIRCISMLPEDTVEACE